MVSQSEHLERQSKNGDPLETLEATVDFEYFRGWLVEGLGYGDGSKGGRQLKRLVSRENTGSEVGADSAYRSQKNEKWLAERMLASRIRRPKPAGKPMAEATARANARKSSIRAAVEHVFANQKNRFGSFIRTIGIARAEAKPTLANIGHNMDRLVFHERRMATG